MTHDLAFAYKYLEEYEDPPAKDIFEEFMAHAIPLTVKSGARVMVFIDGENLSIRYGNLLNGKRPATHTVYEKDVYVWSSEFNKLLLNHDVVRKYYYTAVTGDHSKVDRIVEALRAAGCAPRVFKKYAGKSKAVDIALSVDMLTHAHLGNYDLAVLVAGDGDYAPLIDAVQYTGARVVLWFFDNGLNKRIKMKADHFYDIGRVLFNEGRMV